jgi:hypothetical protein
VPESRAARGFLSRGGKRKKSECDKLKARSEKARARAAEGISDDGAGEANFYSRAAARHKQ